MNASIGLVSEEFNDSILPSQYGDLIGRRARMMEGEHRLLWAVLEAAVRSYLNNMARSTPNQRQEFEEVRGWFNAKDRSGDLFAFETICDFLEIDPRRLIKNLESIRAGNLPHRKRRVGRGARRLAA